MAAPNPPHGIHVANGDPPAFRRSDQEGRGESCDPATALNVVKMFAGTQDMFEATIGFVNLDPRGAFFRRRRQSEFMFCPQPT